MSQQQLALFGGPKTKTTPFGSGKRFGEEEVRELTEALNQNTLFYHFGEKVNTFLADFNRMYGLNYSVATSSGTAAIHVALGAAGVTVGDEVITSPITDQGTVVGILYQNAIPVFADVEPHSYNLDPKSIEAKITDKTKAIIVVHLAGNPCDMDAIMALADRYNLAVIEDCAQSYLATYKGKLVGTIGDYGCFSTNDFKHISTGDGGIVTINSGKEEDYHRTHAFADKNYQRLGDQVNKDIFYLAPNYRMTELQGAVGIAQLKKLPWICDRRNESGQRLHEGIKRIKGLHPMAIDDDNWCSYWFYMFRIDKNALSCTSQQFSKALQAEGIPNRAGYLPKTLYEQPMFLDKQAYLDSEFPFDLTEQTYHKGDCPVAEEALETAILITLTEFYHKQDMLDIVKAIEKVTAYYR